MPCAGKLMNSQFNLLHKTKNIRKNKKEPKIKKKMIYLEDIAQATNILSWTVQLAPNRRGAVVHE